MKRNVLLIVIDALRADKIYGDGSFKSAKTPFFDNLIKKSTIFNKTFSVTSTTTPSFTSILTGLYPPTHGVRSLYGYKLNKKIPTLPEQLKKNNYNTYAEVTGPLIKEIGLDRGFDHYHYREKTRTHYSSWGSDIIQKIATGYYKEPWFIMLHLWELHAPRFTPNEYNKYEYGWNKYERSLSGVDTFLSKLHASLNDDDIIIVTGDHGEKTPQNIIHKYYLSLERKIKKHILKEKADMLKNMGHGYNVYDYLIRVPLIIKAKNIFAENIVVSNLTSQIDLMPTILDILNLKSSNIKTEGISLKTSNELKNPRKYIFSEACGSVIPDKKMWKVGLRTDKYKYIFNPYSKELHEELYEITKDKNEKINIADKNLHLTQNFRYIIKKYYLK